YTILTLACFLFFSAHELERIPEPVPYLIKSLKLTLIERPDLFFITIWIVMVSTSFMNNIYAASKGLNSIIVKLDRKLFVYISAICSLIISLICNLKLEVERLSNLFSDFGLIFIIGIPLVLLFISLTFKKQEAVSHERK
ncbi:GerAB/ArcD/ProY family transporter, partial [Bacillus sp. JJ722]|uniref:GerAB/ArcD/ProY family transporter n=1 Tax=Bacillus sp. JJ722 TaxID=3122973 RepID=UPI002FFF6757